MYHTQIAMFVIFNLQVIFKIKCTGIFTFYPCTEFHIPSENGTLLTVTKIIFLHSRVLYLYNLQKIKYPNERCTFLQDALSYIV
jgi:hypothetical protein